MDTTVMRLSLFLVVACGACAVQAQPLTDPTRPPALAQQTAPGAPAGMPAGAAVRGPTLQSVLISRKAGGRKVAVIDGEPVALGGTFHGAVLVRVGENEVELRRGSQRQVLKLFASDTVAGARRPVPAQQH